MKEAKKIFDKDKGTFYKIITFLDNEIFGTHNFEMTQDDMEPLSQETQEILIKQAKSDFTQVKKMKF